MNAHALAGGPRPALPPTLQPMALALAAPRTDKRLAFLGSAVAYVLLPAAALLLGKVAPIPVPTSSGRQPETVVLLDPPTTSGPVAGPTIPALPQVPTGPATAPLSEFRPADPTADPAPLGELLARGPQAPGGTEPGPGGPGGGTGPTGLPTSLPAGLPGPGLPGGSVLQVSADAVRILHQEVPVYPAVARAAKQQGDVVVRMVIDPHGVPTSVQVEQGPSLLRAAAEQSARQWRFSPALVNGQPVSASFLLTLKFRLQ